MFHVMNAKTKAWHRQNLP